MPPYCDSLDGPVVGAARRALEARDVRFVLPYVPASSEHEVEAAFARALEARGGAGHHRDLVDLWFFESVVRLHRAGEGAPYTGLKPAGLDVGPIVPVAERAIETGDPAELVALLTGKLRLAVLDRFHAVVEARQRGDASVVDARSRVEAELGLERWSDEVARLLADRDLGGRVMGHRHEG